MSIRLSSALALAVIAIGPAFGVTLSQAQTLPPTPDAVSLEQMRKWVDLRNDPRIIRKMIVLNDHEAVDCVVATLQHGYDKPIVIDPLPDDTQAQPEPPKFPSAAKQSVQDYGTITERCPSDTIARKHFDLDELTQFSTLDEFLDVVGGRDRRYAPMVTGYREYASAAQAYSGTAASTVLSINKPTDEHSEEMSISQLWLVSQLNQPDQETIEVGWQVARSRHSGVRDPYLFVFWALRDNQ